MRIAIALLLFPVAAFAGGFTVKDRASLFTDSDRSMMEQSASGSPFTVHVLTEAAAPNQAAWEAEVSGAVTASDVLAIGVEKAHRWTTVKAGGSTGIPAGNGASLGDFGNGFFKSGNFGAGIDAIIVHATQVRAATPVIVDMPTGRGVQPIVLQTTAPIAPRVTDGPGGWFWFLMFAAIAIGGIWFVIKRRKINATLRETEMERDEARADRVINEKPFAESPPVSTPRRSAAPDPVRETEPRRYVARPRAIAPSVIAPVVQQQTAVNSGGNDLVTGILIGEAISRPREVVRETVYERHTYQAPREEPAPSSSSTSSWSDSSSSSSSDMSSWSGGDSGGNDTSGW